MAAQWEFLDWAPPLPFAHRGGAAERPENTMAAFSAAIALGYRYLETDVRATADAMLVAFHDRTLDRVAGRPGRISHLRRTELASVRVGGEPVPLLADVLGSWPEARLSIDVKHDRAVAPLLEVLDRTAAHHRVCVSAFSDRRLARIRARSGGRVRTTTGLWEMAALGLGRSRPGAPATTVKAPLRCGPVTVVTERLVRAAHRRGRPVHVYTADARLEIEALMELGVDGIMTDRPTVLKQVLVDRGLWQGGR